MPTSIGPRSSVLLIAFVLLATELGLRTRDDFANHPRAEPSARYGYRFIPSTTFVNAHGTTVRVNSAGCVDREWTDVDPATLRIAVLGDSRSLGLNVEEDRIWCRVLEARLRAREAAAHQRSVLVQNYAVSGHTLEQNARIFDDEIAPLRPALVVIGIGPHAIRPMRERSDPAFVPLRRWILCTALYELFDRNFRRFARTQAPLDVRRAEASVQSNAFASENDPLWSRAVARLDGMRRTLALSGGRLVIVALPMIEDVFEPPPRSPFETWARAHADVVWIDPLPELALAMAPLVEEIRARDIAPARIRHAANAGGTTFEHAGASMFELDDAWHLTQAGHSVVADVIERVLVHEGLP